MLQIAGAVGPETEQKPPPHLTPTADADPTLKAADAQLAAGDADGAVQMLRDAMAAAGAGAAAAGGEGPAGGEDGAAATDAVWRQVLLETAVGDRLRRMRRFEEAQAVLTAALSKRPAYAHALSAISMCFIDEQQPSKALTYLQALQRYARKWPGLDMLFLRARADKLRTENLYAALELAYDFRQEELKPAYKRRSRLVHPDRKGGSTHAFELVARAYKELGDPNLRQVYDDAADLVQDPSWDGRPVPSFKEQVDKEYFPERFGFLPFGSPFENKEHVMHERWV